VARIAGQSPSLRFHHRGRPEAREHAPRRDAWLADARNASRVEADGSTAGLPCLQRGPRTAQYARSTQIASPGCAPFRVTGRTGASHHRHRERHRWSHARGRRPDTVATDRSDRLARAAHELR
jgi:hypothetical protein